MTTAIDTVWVGMSSGHILLFHEEEVLAWYHPYSEYVRFLCSIPCTGPCDTEQCMVVSGAKGFCSQTLVPKIGIAEEDCGEKLGVLVLWEAYSSRIARQIKFLEEHSNSFFENHDSVRRMFHQGAFRDGPKSQVEGAQMAAIEVFDVKLPTEAIVQVSCPKPAQLKVLLSELQVRTGLQEEHCKVEYYNNDSGEIVQIQTQKQLDCYHELIHKSIWTPNVPHRDYPHN